MASIISGFEYDIFISYRQKDNKGDRWVTEFVHALRAELDAAFKEDISIYFDENPHDGLLETHDVDESLKEKLKCLIFIPIVSQTYCDPKSFAWKNEFLAFKKLAGEDQFGLKVKLQNGNVASRILPIGIHELNENDRSLIENEIGQLRPVHFIFKAVGVNRPLRAQEENPQNNLNKTSYRDQINKTANAIRELIDSLKSPSSSPSTPGLSFKEPSKKTKRYLSIASCFLILIALAGYFVYPRVVSLFEKEVTDKSIAVLPFTNMSNDPEQEHFGDGVSEEIINLLVKIPQLKVIGRTSSFYYKGKDQSLTNIGEKLGVALLLNGNVRRDADRIRISVELVRSKDGVQLWGNTYERQFEKLFQLEDEIAAAVLQQLKLKLMDTSAAKVVSFNPDAYTLMLKGNFFLDQRKAQTAHEFYSQALALDSLNPKILSQLAIAKTLVGNESLQNFKPYYYDAKKLAEKALTLDHYSGGGHFALGIYYMVIDFDWARAETEFKEAVSLEPGNSDFIRGLGRWNMNLGRFQIANHYYQQAVSLNPLNVITIRGYGENLANQGKYDEAIQILISGHALNENYFNGTLISIGLRTGNIELTKKYFEKLPTRGKEYFAPMLYFILSDREKFDLAEKKLLDLYSKKEIGTFAMARMYAFVGRIDESLKYLEKSYQEGFAIGLIKTEILMYKLKGDKRYEDILKKINLPVD